MSIVCAGPDGLDAAARALITDGVVVLPTDTVYGVAVRADHPDAADVLAAAKGRPPQQAIAVLVADVAQAEQFAILDDRALALVASFWPGPLTLVVPRRAEVTWQLGRPDSTIGVRCPDAVFIAELARRVGPMAVTSANRHGRATPPDAPTAAAGLEGTIDLVVDGGPCVGRASTVVDLVADSYAVLRAGAVSAAALAAVLGSS